MFPLKSTSARSLSIMLLATAIFAPITAQAYLLPEDVLMGNDLYVPPSTRDAQQRAEDQAALSAERREAEQAAEFARQHPAPPPEPEVSNTDNDIPLDMGVNVNLGTEELELLRTIRLLDRVDRNQYIVQHSGAPQPLAPTGAGGILASITMIGAVGWTLKRAGKRMGWASREF